MSGAESQHAEQHKARLALLAQIEQTLETCKTRIDDEVKNYPRPITACDVQFEHALEQQAGVRRALRHAGVLRENQPEGGEFARIVDEFVAACAFINAESAQEIRSTLANLLEDADARAD